MRKQRISIRQSNDVALCKQLHTKAFPGDEFDPGDIYWVATNARGNAVGYCSVRVLKEGAVFLNRACVSPSAAGNGVQRRMINLRLLWCDRNGYEYAITYAKLSNTRSWVNLIRAGMKVYVPAEYWGGRDAMYFYWRSAA